MVVEGEAESFQIAYRHGFEAIQLSLMVDEGIVKWGPHGRREKVLGRLSMGFIDVDATVFLRMGL